MAETYALVPVSKLRRPTKEELKRRRHASKALGFGIASFTIAIYNFFCELCLIGTLAAPPVFLIVHLLFGWLWFILYVIAFVFGIIAISNGKKAKGIQKGKSGKGFGTAGLVISIVMLSLSALLVIGTILLVGFAGIAALIVYIVGGTWYSSAASGTASAIALLTAVI